MGQDGDVPYCGPAFLCFLKGQVRPPMTLGMTWSGNCGQGLTGLLFAFFLLRLSPPAWVQCSVWKGLPRIGQVSLCGCPFSLSPAGFLCPG